jgi:hypothetical protein
MMKEALPYRAWYYLRMGYTTYLAFMIAAVNALVTVYYLAIQNVPSLQTVFPSFASWAAIMAVIFIPAGVTIGWLHVKRSPAYRSEIDVLVEANQYYYKLPPGFWKEALVPAMLETLRLNVKILNKEELSNNEIESLKGLQKKLENLIQGGYVGKPPRTTTKSAHGSLARMSNPTETVDEREL